MRSRHGDERREQHEEQQWPDSSSSYTAGSPGFRPGSPP